MSETQDIQLVRFERDLLHQAQKLAEITARVDKQDGKVDAIQLDVRQLIVELKNTSTILQEVARSLQDHRTMTTRLQTIDESQQKAIDGLNQKGWAVVSGLIASTIAAIYSVIKQ